ncbi:MAG: methyltransferase domain-containing protein [Desulfobacterales bacterium]|nr:methyltransferase domain-containing protein [Candidatus Omnitrophota bacterium]MCG2775633.1 methyltransferase domain-containing protein [Desulfobacterales bacterium]
MVDTTDSWSIGKQRHKELSDRAAKEYDQIYAASNFATGNYMNYELEVINRAIELLDKNCRRIALDLGCGTGRDAFHFHKHFVQVRGYDFSREMIMVAQKKKLHKSAGNIQFILRDLEEDLLTDISNSTIFFINSGFGMGSFVQELSPLLREIKRVLEYGGIFVASFYNRESLVVQLDRIEWAPSLAARLDPNTGFLKVNFKGDNFDIAVRAYSVNEIRDMLGSYFEIVELSTFPTLSSLFPNTIFSSKKARELCTIVDRELRFSEQISGGPYIVAICRKKGRLYTEPEPFGYMNIIRLLKDNHIIPNVKEHAPVTSPDDVATTLHVEKAELIKSILIRINPLTETGSPVRQPKYYTVALQAHRRMDFAKVAHILEVKREQIEIATTHEVEEITGFSIGGIPPFGYPHSINVILDNRVKDLDMVYCGTGKRTESLRIAVVDLIKLAAPVIADVSKE